MKEINQTHKYEKDKSTEGTGSTKEKSVEAEDQASIQSTDTGGKEASLKEDVPSLKDVIKEQATEDERSFSSSLTLSKILGGDILTTRTIRHQIWLILLIALFILIYIANGYSCRQDLIQIDKLTQELQDAKFKALSTHSQITEKSRESNVLEMLKDNKDSVLHIADQPPYIINVPDDDQ